LKHMLRKRRKTDYVDHQPKYYTYKETVYLYWALKGTLPDREVYLMTEAARLEGVDTALKNGDIGYLSKSTHGLSLLKGKTREKVLSQMTPDELVTLGEVLELLDRDFSEEMTDIERFYHGVQYIKWLRWVVYTFDMDFSDFRKSDLALESQFHKNQMDFYGRLHDLRREKAKSDERGPDFIIETLPEDNVSIKKVKYDEKAIIVETRPPESSSGED